MYANSKELKYDISPPTILLGTILSMNDNKNT